MTIEPIITRLIGKAEQGDAGPVPQPAGAGDPLGRRLREILGEDAIGRHDAPDRGSAEEAAKLAAYLDGSMDAGERTDYERALADSPQRRDELIGATAWLDAIDANKQAPPGHLTAHALALDTPSAAAVTAPRLGIVSFVEWLFPRPRLAMATSAISAFAIVAVGLDVAFHLNAPEQPSAPWTSPERGFMPPPPGATDQPWINPTILQGGQGTIAITADLRTAAIGYHDDPSPAHRQQLLAALARAGMAPLDVGRVQMITVQARLYDQLPQRSPRVSQMSVSLSADGDLELGPVRSQPN